MTEEAKTVVDAVSVTTTVSALMGWLPAVAPPPPPPPFPPWLGGWPAGAAALSILGTVIRIWETDTVQNWFKDG